MSSRFYDTNPDDPDAPTPLAEYRGLRPGDSVRYAPRDSPHTLDEPLVITELNLFGLLGVQAILNDGEYEVSADNLVKAT